MQQADPAMCRMMRFKDDPRKGDHEYLRLEMDLVPLWRPGHSMRAPEAGRDERSGTRDQRPTNEESTKAGPLAGAGGATVNSDQ